MQSFTQALSSINDNKQSLDRLIILAYDRLHVSAKNALGYSNDATALQATELVSELYLYFRKKEHMNFTDSAHFFATVSIKLRHILHDRFKRKSAQKRDFGIRVNSGELEKIECNGTPLLERILANNLIERLADIDKTAGQIADLLIFWEFSNAEVAEILGISERTVYRKWKWAIAWFKTEATN